MNPIGGVFTTITFAGLLVSSIYGAAINNTDGTCVCTREFNPCCGSNGVTYSNECLFNCEKGKHPELHLNHYGDCEEELEISLYGHDACACSLDYNPVCGTNDETYPNECSLKCHQKRFEDLKIAYEGECKKLSEKAERCKCSREYFPICGTDNQTYDNECQLNCQRRRTPQLGVQFHGRCDEAQELKISLEDEDDCICTRIFDPVCGSDGKTYSNECHFNCQKNKHMNLKLAHRGECEPIDRNENVSANVNV